MTLKLERVFTGWGTGRFSLKTFKPLSSLILARSISLDSTFKRVKRFTGYHDSGLMVTFILCRMQMKRSLQLVLDLEFEHHGMKLREKKNTEEIIARKILSL
jgi:hypothetical protein